MKCRNCGGSFTGKNYNVKYCSCHCRNVLESIIARIRASKKNIDWKNSVINRDGHKCKNCGAKNVRLEAHHLKSVV
jgi:ribosomal protein L37AE/L43A